MTDIIIKHPYNFVNLIGNRYGRLIVIKEFGKIRDRFAWICRCDCGNERIVHGSHLKNGNTKSCGCLHKEIVTNQEITHGMSNTPEFRTWSAMKDRCLRKKGKAYKNYGGRGIKICERWLENFENFLEDMGKKPSPKHSIDRVDNSKDYEKSNCRWATAKEQARNQRTNKIVEYDGKMMSLAEACELAGVNYRKANNRLRLGWESTKVFQ